MSKLQYIIDAVEDAINERELLLLRLREQNANSVYEPKSPSGRDFTASWHHLRRYTGSI
jgi:hypothetical protein